MNRRPPVAPDHTLHRVAPAGCNRCNRHLRRRAADSRPPFASGITSGRAWEVRLTSEREVVEQPPLPPPSAALRAARRLVTRALAHQGEPASGRDHVTNALDHACAVVLNNVREAMGEDGCDALFGRAASRSATLHPVLQKLRDQQASGISREQLSAAVDANAAAAQAAIEALLASLIEILARLIGEDMALQIIAPDSNDRASDEADREPQRGPPAGTSGETS